MGKLYCAICRWQIFDNLLLHVARFHPEAYEQMKRKEVEK